MTGVDVVEQALVRVVPHQVGKAKEGRRALQGRDHPEQCYRAVLPRCYRGGREPGTSGEYKDASLPGG